MPKLPPDGLRTAVYQAVDQAVRIEGPGFSRSDVVGRFLDKGTSRATLFKWIKAAMAGHEERARQAKPKRGRPRKEAPPVVQAVTVRDSDIEAPADQGTGVSYIVELQDSLRRLKVMLQMAEGEDGKVRNVRLALNSIDLIGKTLERAARISATVQDMEAQRKFLKSLADVIYRQPSAVRDAIVAEMRALGADGGGIL